MEEIKKTLQDDWKLKGMEGWMENYTPLQRDIDLTSWGNEAKNCKESKVIIHVFTERHNKEKTKGVNFCSTLMLKMDLSALSLEQQDWLLNGALQETKDTLYTKLKENDSEITEYFQSREEEIFKLETWDIPGESSRKFKFYSIW